MATLAETLGAQANPDIDIASGLSEGVSAGIKLATAKEQIDSAKVKVEEQKLELDQKKLQAFDGMIKTLNRTNPAYTKTLAKTMKNRFQQYGFDPNIVDVVISDPNFGRVYQNLSDAMLGNVLNDRNALSKVLQSSQDAGLFTEAVTATENALKRKQQDEQFDIQMAKTNKQEAKQDEKQKREDEKITRQETQKLSAALSQNSIPDMVQAIKDIDQQIGGMSSNVAEKKLDKIAGLKGFAAQARIPFTNVTPFEGLALNDEDKPLYQSISGLKNVVLKLRSGGAITDSEATRMLEELGQGSARSGSQLLTGIKNVTNKVRATIQTIESGFDPSSVDVLAARGNPTSSASLPNAQLSKPSSKPPFDPVAFRKMALEQNYTEQEIDDFIKEQKQ